MTSTPTLDRPEARPSMDPRIRARRVAVTRQEGRRRLRVALIFVTVLVLAGLGALGARSPLLDVDHVRVEGTQHTPVLDVLAAAGLDHHRAMMDVDTGAGARRVERLPWVERARVVRTWPGTVRVVVVERTAMAMVASSGACPGTDAQCWASVDGTGRVLAASSSPPAGLVRLDGVDPAPAPGQSLGPGAARALAVLRGLPPRLRPEVTAVGPGADGLVLHLVAAAGHPGGMVRLGTAERLADALTAAATVLATVDPTAVAVLDVSVPSAPVLVRAS